MKHYSFEYVPGENNKVDISLQHHTNPFLHNIKLKIICLLLAALFWLIATDVQLIKANKESAEKENTQVALSETGEFLC